MSGNEQENKQVLKPIEYQINVMVIGDPMDSKLTTTVLNLSLEEIKSFSSLMQYKIQELIKERKITQEALAE